MPPVYFINLDARTDRRDFMQDQFARLGIDAQRVSAVLAADVPQSLIDRTRPRPGARKLTPSEFACNLSHLKALRLLIDSGMPAGLVLEDDGILAQELPEFLKLFEHGLPAGVDIIKLETFQATVRLGSSSSTPLPGYELRRLMSTHHGSCGYLISRRTALEVLADPNFGNFAVDGYLFGRVGHMLFRRKILQLVPALVVQLRYHPSAGRAEAESSIDHLRGLKRRRGARQRLYRLIEDVHSAAKEAVYFAHDPRALLTQPRRVPFAGEAALELGRTE